MFNKKRIHISGAKLVALDLCRQFLVMKRLRGTMKCCVFNRRLRVCVAVFAADLGDALEAKDAAVARTNPRQYERPHRAAPMRCIAAIARVASRVPSRSRCGSTSLNRSRRLLCSILASDPRRLFWRQ